MMTEDSKTERRAGKTKLVYDKARRTIVHVATSDAAPVNASMGEAKPLAWEQSGPFSRASAVGVEYEILDSTPAWERPFQLLIRWGFSKKTVKFFRTLKEAQDFAQADIGERISSASQAAPRPSSELVAALVAEARAEDKTFHHSYIVDDMKHFYPSDLPRRMADALALTTEGQASGVAKP